MYRTNLELALFNTCMALMMVLAGVAYAVCWPLARIADAVHGQPPSRIAPQLSNSTNFLAP